MNASTSNYDIGQQYAPDDEFKAAARLHQSQYRANVLKVDCDGYGSRLTEQDARRLLNYYDGLNVRGAWHKRQGRYSKKRDADMLRSEHIPFNFFAPLDANRGLAGDLIRQAFRINCEEVTGITIEYAPAPRSDYLDDRTAFDVYVHYLNSAREECGIGIEVKYTEREYKIGRTEEYKVGNMDSPYWRITRSSGAFIDNANPDLGSDSLRQIWRNHLLGLAMLGRNKIKEFTSVILYPFGNQHFNRVIPQYQGLLRESHRCQVQGCTYETFIAMIQGDEEVGRWKDYLTMRYLVRKDGAGKPVKDKAG